ncbi:hypothetical protein TWF569_006646 [Orbilia oligospora]|uniref:ER-bound oxygenase mpaB/mpaB'/Rubber oxygenase catalytic domain-containing protein n=1 Tax=Orbilia oligospora TaxID=2813651 RepID=A0A7C8NJQ5_ORBOL|nr:hypothetical protein TWF706_011413 [Orbilia oligospora]KAF3119373.1 hypothetical protein TWF594_004894 [Orbilia oligospora]KAF3133672.1 hypothetical protein TWF703_006729 [Orbilia oligospora]KAF3145016.1 hypothetical protein TWF569_006646 [Orbilia oligospora]
MDSIIFMLESGLLVLLPFTALTVAHYARKLHHLWREFRTTQFIWQNQYHSFEELHSLYDRGDIMLSAVLIASSLQLSHRGMAKAIEAHSTYKSDPWRRLTRTLAFIYIMVRSNKGTERQQAVQWLQKIHHHIPLFEFETNVFVFATFAYALAKSHEFLRRAPDEAERIVKGVMGMADKLDLKDACPSMLTFDGTLELLITRYPNLEDVPIGLYREIFGAEGKSTPRNLPGQGLRKRGGTDSWS